MGIKSEWNTERSAVNSSIGSCFPFFLRLFVCQPDHHPHVLHSHASVRSLSQLYLPISRSGLHFPSRGEKSTDWNGLFVIYSSPPSFHHCTKQNNSETGSTITKLIKGTESFAPQAKSKQGALIMNDSEEHDNVNSFFWAALSEMFHCQMNSPL